MGMAASQARFLGLTARKSNVEYQGQQVNQQRTALANESANLYNQMMELVVPTPPSNSDYYKTSYVLEGTGGDYDKGAYKIASLSKTYTSDGQYTVTLSREIESKAYKPESYKVAIAPIDEEKDGILTTTVKIKNSNGVTSNLSYLQEKNEDETYTPIEAYNEKGLIADIKANQVYAIKTGTVGESEYEYTKPEGYDECTGKEKGGNLAYFYQDAEGKNHFLTEEQFQGLFGASAKADDEIGVSTTYTKSDDYTTQANAYLETKENGRYTSIVFADDDSIPFELRNKTIALSTVQEFDQDGYDQAMNDYEYDKAAYEKSISDINAKTEIIQKQDQQLELRLQQLDTEQSAIKTEMDSVNKVISDNVEKTFNVFA